MSLMGDTIDIFGPQEPDTDLSPRGAQVERTERLEPFIPPYVTTAPPRPRRDRTRLALVLTTCLLVLALGAGSAAYVYSNNSAREWRATSERLSADLTAMTALRDEVGAQLGQSQAALAQTKDSLKKVTQQYNDAAARIRDLADEKAQADDSLGVMGTAIERSRNVALQLDQCVAGLQELQQHLVGIDAYNASEVLGVAKRINVGCDEAQAGSDAFVAWLEGN